MMQTQLKQEEELKKQASKKNLTKAAKSDKISEALLDRKDINFKYDSTSNFITKVEE